MTFGGDEAPQVVVIHSSAIDGSESLRARAPALLSWGTAESGVLAGTLRRATSAGNDPKISSWNRWIVLGGVIRFAGADWIGEFAGEGARAPVMGNVEMIYG